MHDIFPIFSPCTGYTSTPHIVTRFELFSVISLRRKRALCLLLFPTQGRGKASHTNWENKRNSSRCLSMFPLTEQMRRLIHSLSLAVAAINSNHSDNYGYKCTRMYRNVACTQTELDTRHAAPCRGIPRIIIGTNMSAQGIS